MAKAKEKTITVKDKYTVPWTFFSLQWSFLMRVTAQDVRLQMWHNKIFTANILFYHIMISCHHFVSVSMVVLSESTQVEVHTWQDLASKALKTSGFRKSERRDVRWQNLMPTWCQSSDVRCELEKTQLIANKTLVQTSRFNLMPASETVRMSMYAQKLFPWTRGHPKSMCLKLCFTNHNKDKIANHQSGHLPTDILHLAFKQISSVKILQVCILLVHLHVNQNVKHWMGVCKEPSCLGKLRATTCVKPLCRL